MNKTYFPKINDETYKTYQKCPICSKEWLVRYYYFDNDKSNIIPEYKNVTITYRNDISIQSTNMLKVTYCWLCMRESKQIYNSGDDIINKHLIEENKVAEQLYENIKNNNTTIKIDESQLNDDILNQIISNQ